MVLRRRSALSRPLMSKQRRWGAGVPKDMWRWGLLNRHVICVQSAVWKGWRLYQHRASSGNWTLNPSGNFVKYAAQWLSHADQKCHPALSSCQKEPVKVLGALTNYCSLYRVGEQCIIFCESVRICACVWVRVCLFLKMTKCCFCKVSLNLCRSPSVRW